MSTEPAGPILDTAAVADTFTAIQHNVERAIEGKSDVVRLALLTLLSEGHVLLEDVPGVGKTLLAKALGRSINCSVKRVQFTPDLLPSDITGVTIYNQEQGVFEFKPGAVFANIVLGDEINRAGPKTQSALLESMEERQVTTDGRTYELASPFMVIATQNPIELDGTYPLPEAQRDRFMTRLRIGYPSADAEVEVLRNHGAGNPVDTLEPVTTTHEVNALIDACKHVQVAESLERYVVDIVRATREHELIDLGASPRAGLGIMRGARALAATHGREYVIADDIKDLADPVLAHRLVLGPDAELAGRTESEIVADVVTRVPVPRGRR
ncbi:AAA family ATPase [Egibacter rhizosphaerae]|uniref:AAA family ATPase n=1 Tax=Egibacter rhizosphaerae TaxID=1670831 RepID=UPI001F117622|nr:MoxR family ATPase [Egibacter rhizosphaerae]